MRDGWVWLGAVLAGCWGDMSAMRAGLKVVPPAHLTRLHKAA